MAGSARGDRGEINQQLPSRCSLGHNRAGGIPPPIKNRGAMISEECTKLATSLMVLRDLARDIRDMLGRLDIPAHYPDIFRVQLAHAHKSGYITDTEFNDLKNLMADVEGHLPAEPLPKGITAKVMEKRMRKLQHSLSDAIKLKDKAEDILFQKVVDCECQRRKIIKST